MPYVKRNPAGEIVAMSRESADGFDESLEPGDAELDAFLRQLQSSEESARDLASTDLSFIRVLEDLIALLVSRNVIRFTDLPAAAQAKMLERQHLRHSLEPHLDLLDDEREDSLI